ncbi:MAG: D-glycero-beta-D-manno-heptose-7-phosphate kinase [bacterium]
MVTFTPNRLESILERCSGKKIAVIGDVMLDRYIWGSVARISPEAPVPVVEVESESTRLGGASNVANNIASLGGIPVMIGVVGNDEAGKELQRLIESGGFPSEGIVIDASRPTTVKTRVIAHHQHVVRVDKEVKREIEGPIKEKVIDALKRMISSVDAVILEDYNKGMIVKDLIPEMIDLALKNGKIITVDPKFNNFFEYKKVTVFKPNRNETEAALGCRLNNTQSVERSGFELLKRLEAENVLLTRGEDGMSLFENNAEVVHVETQARQVADVSGAGDTVISTLTMALAAGSTIREAASLANFAGGIVCGEVGIVPIDRTALYRAVLET